MFNHPQNYISSNRHFRDSSLFSEFSENPLGFIDIGARGGAHDLVVPVAEIVSVVGFEPDEKECSRLMNIPESHEPWAQFRLEPIALASETSTQILHLAAANTNHSLRPPNPDFVSRYEMKQFKKIGECTVEAQNLDEIFRERFKEQANFGEFIKLDTQGTEWEILKGSVETLSKNTVAVVSEVSFFEIYQGQKLFSEVELFMRELGFSFYGFSSNLHTRSRKLLDKRSHVTRERVMYSDAVFLKDPIKAKTENSDRQNRALLLCSLLLGYYDFTLELARDVIEWEDASDKQSIQKLVASLSKISPEDTLSSIEDVAAKAKADPDAANMIVGSFVDERRQFCDYDDVAKVSQHIKNAH